MATKMKAKDVEESSVEYLFPDNDFSIVRTTRDIINSVVQVEPIRRILNDLKKITDSKTKEDLENICRKFKLSRNLWAGKEPETIKAEIRKHFIDIISNKENLTDTYLNYFSECKAVYNFVDCVVYGDHLQNPPSGVKEHIPYTKDILGKGADINTLGEPVNITEEQVDLIVYEICHFLGCLSGAGDAFLPDKTLNFDLDVFENDESYLVVDYKNPFDLVE